ncbi:MAG: hypothetical protein ACFFAE_07620 [Candidatus Hodarchaeota archaeon]
MQLCQACKTKNKDIVIYCVKCGTLLSLDEKDVKALDQETLDFL